MNRDLDVYAYHPRPRMLWAPMVIIAAMGVLGFVRGLLGASDLSLQPTFGDHSPVKTVGVDPRPVVLQTIPSLTPRLIGIAPPQPRAPTAVNTVAVNAVAATNAPTTTAATPAASAKLETVPTEAAPASPVPISTPAPPPAPLQGLY